MSKQPNITFVINPPRGGRTLPARATVEYPKGYKKTKDASKYEKYKPEKWESVRPGADDHLQCPSRRGDELVKHRGPITLIGDMKTF